MQHGTSMNDEMRRCVDECLSCFRTCLESVTHCLEKGGRHAEASHIRLLLDCAEICETSAGFMLRTSDLHIRGPVRYARRSVNTARGSARPLAMIRSCGRARRRAVDVRSHAERWPVA